jgi:prepilin-type N-terminal cleavage/methylation domain-containing protein
MFALRPPGMHAAGLTLVEMVVTVAVLSIVALVAVPRADSASSFAGDALAGEVANALRFGQQEAIRTGRYHVVKIDPTTHTLSVYRMTASGAIGRDTGFTVLHPVDRREYSYSVAGNGFPAATIAGSVFKYKDGAVFDYASFGPDGAPAYIHGSWDNGLDPSTERDALDGDAVVTIRHGQAERQVRLNAVTGRVTF